MAWTKYVLVCLCQAKFSWPPTPIASLLKLSLGRKNNSSLHGGSVVSYTWWIKIHLGEIYRIYSHLQTGTEYVRLCTAWSISEILQILIWGNKVENVKNRHFWSPQLYQMYHIDHGLIHKVLSRLTENISDRRGSVVQISRVMSFPISLSGLFFPEEHLRISRYACSDMLFGLWDSLKSLFLSWFPEKSYCTDQDKKLPCHTSFSGIEWQLFPSHSSLVNAGLN